MEKQNLSLYAKLKNSLYKEITVSYYTNSTGFKTESFKLIDVYGFLYLTVGNKKAFFEMSFFGSTLIESITIAGEDKPIYFNPYIRKHLNPNVTLSKEINKKIETDFKANTDMEQIITQKELFLIKYFEKKTIKYEDLFFSEQQKKSFMSLIKLLTDELVLYAKKKGLESNIIRIAGGSTSFVYAIGDKILKFGKPRYNRTIPYCEFLLQPIFNKVVTFDDIPIQLEITQKVLTYYDLNDKDRKKLKQEIPKINRKLRSMGLKCNDLHKRNIGILTSDNVIDFDGIMYQTGSVDATSIANNNNLVIRKKGEVVIIDLDYIEIANSEKYRKYLEKIGYVKPSSDLEAGKNKR